MNIRKSSILGSTLKKKKKLILFFLHYVNRKNANYIVVFKHANTIDTANYQASSLVGLVYLGRKKRPEFDPLERKFWHHDSNPGRPKTLLVIINIANNNK